MKKFTPVTILLLIALLLAACGGANEVANNNVADNNAEVNNAPVVEEPIEEMPEELPSIAEIAAGDENFSTLVTALSAAGLVDTLAGEGEFTVFAPTNDAFDALGETLDAVLADSDLLNRVLLYHVVSGVVPAEAALTLDGQMVETLSGDKFSVSIQDGDLYIDNAKVIMTDIEASNGIIHVIDAVLVPADDMAEELPSIAEVAAGDENFSTLVTALSAAGLVDTLAGEGEFTVFAPTNEAFEALGETLDAVLADSELLNRVLLYHVVSGVVPAETALTLDGQMVETLSGDKFSVSIQDGDLYIDNAKVIMTDIEASNGIIHVIDAVLVPGQDEMASDDMAEELPSIAEIAAGDENFSTLVTALSAAGLVDTLAGEGEFTVFAPTNEAFEALGETLDAVLADSELLNRVLLYHVVSGVVPAETALTLDGQMVETLSGDMFEVSLKDGDLYINDAKVIMTDIEASNGIIHVIDAVLVPAD